MKIEKDKIVKLTYDLFIDEEGTEVLVESTGTDEPLEFKFGNDEYIDAFEDNIKGMNAGDNFDFVLKSDEAYGSVNEDAVAEIPKDLFKKDGKLAEDLLVEGNYVPLQDEDGNEYDAIIMEISETAVIVDFNHPLAGEDLHFVGNIVDVI